MSLDYFNSSFMYKKSTYISIMLGVDGRMRLHRKVREMQGQHHERCRRRASQAEYDREVAQQSHEQDILLQEKRDYGTQVGSGNMRIHIRSLEPNQ